MKQIVVISGKGGTGKTVIAASFAALANKKVMADCDVDAADLHLLLQPDVRERIEFKSGLTAFINKEVCAECGRCRQLCRFNAISEDFIVDPISCEGCAFCHYACPVEAIEMKENISGEWYVSDTRFGKLVHAKLGIAEENSGKLVSLVRKKAKELAENQESDWIIIDGSPGIGCPVIASLSGVDCALVVTEPTLSGLHDAVRVIKVARHFDIATKVVVNKYDLNTNMSEQIINACNKNDAEVLGRISFDKAVVNAMVQGKTIVEGADGKIKKEVVDIWESLKQKI